ncbi:MAG: hypothetical protein M1833_003233 [Piccolia ochrophora]|nr:MAG: hypothetical protein M1833_003233 [Piccolia ochrophora]
MSIDTLTHRQSQGAGSNMAGEEPDELSSLLSHNLTFSPIEVERASHTPEQLPKEDTSITYSVSQHYHHSSHLASTAVPSSPVAPAFGAECTDPAAAELALWKNGVDPASLFPSQLDLFQQADLNQKLRLIQLWRISSSGQARQFNMPSRGSWPTSQIEQQNRTGWLHVDQQQPGGTDNNSCLGRRPISDGDWATERPGQRGILDLPQEVDRDPGMNPHPGAEPYIVSGYDNLATQEYEEGVSQLAKEQFQPFGSVIGRHSLDGYNNATDPVYRGPEGWNVEHQDVSERQDLAFQYGGFDQLNQFGAAPSAVVHLHGDGDAEMS